VTIWLDAQLSPALATWVRQVFLVEAVPVRDPGLRDAADAAIFESARSAMLSS
jgi:predicted nuclease of predicted toxin-antitoxin system